MILNCLPLVGSRTVTSSFSMLTFTEGSASTTKVPLSLKLKRRNPNAKIAAPATAERIAVLMGGLPRRTVEDNGSTFRSALVPELVELSFAINSSADPILSSADFLRSDWRMVIVSLGMSVWFVGNSSDSLATDIIVEKMFDFSKGELPVNISNRTEPTLNKSLRASSSLPWTCSGDMYRGVPRIVPVAVKFVVSLTTRAKPKSSNLISPSLVIQMFSGLMSRWRKPSSWA